MAESTVTKTLDVTGLTCNHCVASVTEEVHEIPGVARVEVDLQPGEISKVTVISEGDLPDDALRDAIAEAGYELKEIHAGA